MSAVVGQVYADIVLLASGATGQTFTRLSSKIGTTDTVWTPTFTELSNGGYLLTFTPAAAGIHSGLWQATDLSIVPLVIPVITAAQSDPAAALSASEVIVVSPVDSITNNVTLYQADSYDADDSRALDWATTDAATWPTLTGATIAFRAEHRTAGTAITATGSVVTGTGDDKQVRVELAPADTSSAAIGAYTYQVVATLTNTHVVTLATGKLTLIERI